MEVIDAIILGLVQGITEFLPVSSTGHLILVRDVLGIELTDALAFDAVLHFATTAAVIIYFWNDLWTLMQAVLRKLGRLPVNERDLTLFYALVIGTIPAAVVGFFLEDIVTNYLQSSLIVAGVLMCGAIFFLYAEWQYFQRPTHGSITVKRGLQVGFFQVLALMPGFSRSGATIAGGMILGLSRYEASRFSFLLAIPITLGVGLKKTLDLMQAGVVVEWTPIYIGAGTAFVTALIVTHFFLIFIRKYTLWPFVWYAVVLSAFVGYIYLVG
jgi:undecaprenyl-diphosphatase